MYEKFYSFNKMPFQLPPDPNFLYRSKKHKKALTHLEYGLFYRAGFVVITGEIGTGKTTLLRYMLRSLNNDVPVAFLSQTYLNPDQFLRALCEEFSLPHDGREKSTLLHQFGTFLVEQFKKGKYAILILDEAQNLPVETLEEIRMLSNLDAESELLLQVIFVGQPALREKLRRQELRQLTQRVEVSYHLEPLDLDEVKGYIRYRLERAGAANPNIFDDGAMKAIYQYSEGVPRLINSACHICLMYGMADGVKRFDREVTESILKDQFILDFSPGAETSKGQDKVQAPLESVELVRTEKTLSDLSTKMDRLLEVSMALKLGMNKIASSLNSKPNQGEITVLEKKLAAERARAKSLFLKLNKVEKELSHKGDRVETPNAVQRPGLQGFAENSPGDKDSLIKQLETSLAEEREKSARYQVQFKRMREKLDVLTSGLEQKQGKERKKLTSP
jgi:general secretion pathway protein A